MAKRLKTITNWLILAFVFLLPWQAVYIFDERFINGAKSQYLTGQLCITELLLWLIIILFLLGNFRLSRFKKIPAFDRKNKKQLFIFSLWLFLAYAGLSILWAGDRSAALYLWFRLLEAGALLLIILVSNVSKTKLLWALLLSAGLEGLLAIWQFLSQAINADKWLGIAQHSAAALGDIVIETADGRWLRAYGSFSHPNVLGGFLLLGVIAGLLLWRHYFRSPDIDFYPVKTDDLKLQRLKMREFIIVWLKILSVLIMALTGAAGLFFSFSRSAWLGMLLIIFISLFLLLTKQARDKKLSIFNIQYSIFFLSPILLFLILSVIYSPLVLTRADSDNRLEIRSQTERINQIGEAWQMIKTAPLIGTGLNNYTYQLHRIQPSRPAYELQPVHNICLLIASELGLIGLVLSILLISTALLLIAKNSKSLLLISIIPVFLLISLFDHYFWTTYAGLMVFFLTLTISLMDDNIPDQAH